MFGIEFVGHPGLRQLYLPTDFEGHPLRKDYPLLARRVKPWPGIVDVEPMPERKKTRDDGSGIVMTPPSDQRSSSYIAGQAADARVNVELETEGMTLNIGPQHPATHGTLRIIAKLDGEQVVSARSDHGLHASGLREALRGPHLPPGHHPHQPHRLARKLCQRGAVHPRRRAADGDRGAAAGPVDPHDPVRAEPHRQRHAVPRRHGVQLGAITPVFYAFRDREHVLNQIEGHRRSLPSRTSTASAASRTTYLPGWIAETKQVMKKIRHFCDRDRRFCCRATRSSRPARAASG